MWKWWRRGGRLRQRGILCGVSFEFLFDVHIIGLWLLRKCLAVGDVELDVLRGKALRNCPCDFKLTFLTIPRPYSDLSEDMASRSIMGLSNWLRISGSRVIIFLSESEFDPYGRIIPYVTKIFGRDRIQFAGSLANGLYDRPLIREWFSHGFRMVDQGYLLFLNADMYVPDQWVDAACGVFQAFEDSVRQNVVLFAVRDDTDHSPDFDNLNISSESFHSDLFRLLKENSKGPNPWGMDGAFMHSSFHCLNWTLFPDFVIGKPIWDNFFMGVANDQCETVTMNFDPPIYHLSHDSNEPTSEEIDIFKGLVPGLPLGQHHMAKWMVQWDKRIMTSSTDDILLLGR
jgi:hypothetical protein